MNSVTALGEIVKLYIQNTICFFRVVEKKATLCFRTQLDICICTCFVNILAEI